MDVKSNFKQKNWFCNLSFKKYAIRFQTILNLLWALTAFFVAGLFDVIQKPKSTKTIDNNFIASPGKLERYCKQK